MKNVFTISIIGLLSLQSCKKEENPMSKRVFWMNNEQATAFKEAGFDYVNLNVNTVFIGKLYTNSTFVTAPECGDENAITFESEVVVGNNPKVLQVYTSDTSYYIQQDVEFNYEGCLGFNVFAPDSVK